MIHPPSVQQLGSMHRACSVSQQLNRFSSPARRGSRTALQQRPSDVVASLLPGNSSPQVSKPLAAKQELVRVSAAVAVGIDLLGRDDGRPLQAVRGRAGRRRAAPEQRRIRGRGRGVVVARKGVGFLEKRMRVSLSLARDKLSAPAGGEERTYHAIRRSRCPRHGA